MSEQPYVDWSQAPEGCNAVFVTQGGFTNGIPEQPSNWEKWEDGKVFEWQTSHWQYWDTISGSEKEVYKTSLDLHKVRKTPWEVVSFFKWRDGQWVLSFQQVKLLKRM